MYDDHFAASAYINKVVMKKASCTKVMQKFTYTSPNFL
jgi:hypothetical protein